ncbi:hypothetical protein [Erwinia sp. CGal63]|uniref:hypothetical protein n=1 Tax=Erwinia sp. CGal63 TaxID=2919889 RepID=UPI00300B612E
MARKKIWAYACDKNGQYIRSEKVNKERLYFIWEALKIRDKDPGAFSQLTFMSTQSNKKKRAELVPVKKGFFRYKSDSGAADKTLNPDHDSFSHEMAIAVLAEMKTINFQSYSQAFAITFDELKKDDLKIRFEDGSVYYPDLTGFFSEPADLARKWGGKVALEVKVTHACEPAKIKAFRDHNIPIIEIFLRPSMRLAAEKNKVAFDEYQMERYYHYLQEKFSSVVYMAILSDPTMPDEYEKIVNEKSNELSLAENTARRLNGNLSDLSRINEENSGIIGTLKHQQASASRLAMTLQDSLDKEKIANRKISEALRREREDAATLQKEISTLRETDYRSMSLLKKLSRLFR